MTIEPTPLTGPDLAKGIDIGEVPTSSPLLGHVQGEAVVVVRSGHEFFAVSGTCSHYEPLGVCRNATTRLRYAKEKRLWPLLRWAVTWKVYEL